MPSARIVGLSVFFVMLSASYTSAQVQTIINPPLPSLTDDQTGHTADAATRGEGNVYCRPPQHLNDSRLMGPQVCMSIQKWNALHAEGLDVDASGKVKPRQGLDDLKILGH